MNLKPIFGRFVISMKLLRWSIFIMFLAATFFGWHIHTVYRQVVASSPFGEPLFEREVLESYGEKIVDELASKNVKVAIVSRSGQPRNKLPDGVEYTHSAFWLYEPAIGDSDAEFPQYGVYNLYHGEENRLVSSLVRDEAADFLRLTREHDVGIIIPDEASQLEIMDYIYSPRYGEVHQINYSLISNPFDERYQNCNEFMLDSLAALFWDTPNSMLIKKRFEKSLTPTELKASFIRRRIGPIVDERLIMTDHSGPIVTTTRQTLAAFLQSEGRLESAYVLDLRD